MENKVKNIFIDNDGDAIDLNSVEMIYQLDKKEDRLALSFRFKNGKEISLHFKFEDYKSMNQDQLYHKINAIRSEIVKKWNHGVEPETFFNKIDLVKKQEEPSKEEAV